MQCKERVDLLEALRQSRAEAKGDGDKQGSGAILRGGPPLPKTSKDSTDKNGQGGRLSQSTVPTVNYPDLSKQPPPLPKRPSFLQKKSSDFQAQRSPVLPQIATSTPPPVPSYQSSTIPLRPKHLSRTPSPEKRNRMLTTLRPNKDGKRPSKSPRGLSGRKSGPPAASKAAGLAWDSISRASGDRLGQSLSTQGGSSTTLNSIHRETFGDSSANRRDLVNPFDQDEMTKPRESSSHPHSPLDSMPTQNFSRSSSSHPEEPLTKERSSSRTPNLQAHPNGDVNSLKPATPPLDKAPMQETTGAHVRNRSPLRLPKSQPDHISYRNEYPVPPPISKSQAQAPVARSSAVGGTTGASPLLSRQRSPQRKPRPPAPVVVPRRPVANTSSPRLNRHINGETSRLGSSESTDENTSSSREAENGSRRTPRKKRKESIPNSAPPAALSMGRESVETIGSLNAWEERVEYIKKHLPKGVDENAAKQIFNEIVVQGDEVHWDDVAGLDVAKNALKEAVVYPFLRPDLFMGLREPARGMLLFGPPGTGKTMLARAVATESHSTFFAISASSLTSKWLGESEKLVRALFALARALAPSIIFVDEIDSLLSSRGGSSEHESTRRIKTEFLIQWSDLQRAAAGKEQTDKEKKEGDASRVLVLAATNLPWAIDEAARRRFVRRQYIPLPEAKVRGTQLRTLLGHQKHNLNEQDIQVLVELTDGMLLHFPFYNSDYVLEPHVLTPSFTGFSGSDITALAKDAAMGPLRSLGEALLHMSMDEIRPIQFEDFEASLINIRPSVSKQGLKEFEDWAKEFGERGG